MRVSTTIAIDIDLKEIYTLCKPISLKECNKEVRSFVKAQLDLRATDGNGGWVYPFSNIVAGWLIECRLATEL